MTENPAKKVLAAVKNNPRAVNLILVAGLAGMLLIAVSELIPSPAQEDSTSARADPAAEAAAWEQTLETRLEQLIRQVDGAGETCVMVTLSGGEETVYATDTQTESDGGARRQHLLLAEGSDPPALVESVRTPRVLGVAVLCEGGGDAGVQMRVTQIVQALTDAGASHITVERLAESE